MNGGRLDRRIHLGNWCNQSGAGLGERPKAAPGAGIDAYVWIKPPGESDGASKEIPNNEGKGFDRMCDPTYTGNPRNDNNMSGALGERPAVRALVLRPVPGAHAQRVPGAVGGTDRLERLLRGFRPCRRRRRRRSPTLRRRRPVSSALDLDHTCDAPARTPDAINQTADRLSRQGESDPPPCRRADHGRRVRGRDRRAGTGRPGRSRARLPGRLHGRRASGRAASPANVKVTNLGDRGQRLAADLGVPVRPAGHPGVERDGHVVGQPGHGRGRRATTR